MKYACVSTYVCNLTHTPAIEYKHNLLLDHILIENPDILIRLFMPRHVERRH